MGIVEAYALRRNRTSSSQICRLLGLAEELPNHLSRTRLVSTKLLSYVNLKPILREAPTPGDWNWICDPGTGCGHGAAVKKP